MAKDILPPFVLSLPHPHTPLPLPEMSNQSAKMYNNHVLIVESSEGFDFLTLTLLEDSDMSPNVVALESAPDNWKGFFDEG